MPEKILIVDDDVESLKLIGLMLKRQGYEVVAAHAGQVALQKAHEEQPNLIILDVMMPDMDGYEVCKRLRENPQTVSIPIIMFTAKTMVDDKVAGFEAGADDYLTKPTHPAELSSRVKAVLARSQQQRRDSDSAGTQRNRNMALGFLGVKGGVGTTTLSSSVAGLLAREQQTILTDLRPGQGTLGPSLGYTNAFSLANLLRFPVNEINSSQIQNLLVTHKSGIRLLLSSTNPQESQINMTPDAVSEILKAMESITTHRLFDLGAGLNRVTMRLLRELDRTVLLVEPNHISTILAQATLQEIQTVGVPLDRISLVIYNRTQSTVQLPWQEVEQILGKEVQAIISPAPELAYQAAEAGQPITHFQPSSIVAGQIGKLVEELVRG
jgi:DNA-binding response OmpR family regulator/CO dehydrogenase nickel-insertion accessory protein CooC1